jgi:hypothetical protein
MSRITHSRIWLIMPALIIILALTTFINSVAAADNLPPPPYAGVFHMTFRESAEYSVSAPLYPPPVINIVASVDKTSGWLTDVRWTKHTSMGDFGTFIIVDIDGKNHVFPLAYEHENKRNVGLVYNEGGHFSLPFGGGVRFNKSFEIRVYGLPIHPGQVAGGGGLYNIYVGYRTDN